MFWIPLAIMGSAREIKVSTQVAEKLSDLS